MFEPPLFAVVVAAGLFHLGGRDRSSARWRGRDRLRALWFYSGLVAVLVAVNSPLDSLADRSFTAHMLQHILLLAVAPPLIVAGAPWARMWRPLPLGFRRPVARTVAVAPAGRPLRAVAHLLGRPSTALVVYAADLIAWHVPRCYDLTLRSQSVHDVEHLLFFFTGVLFWTQVIDSPPFHAKLDDLQRGVYLLLGMLVGWVLAVVLAFAHHPFYRPYALVAHRPWGLSALADQQIAAGVMWVPGSLPFTVTFVFFVYRWLDPQRAQAGSRRRRRTLLSPDPEVT